MKLSVVIPIYNEISTLHEAMHRILNANLYSEDLGGTPLDTLEIIAINDGSTDGSAEWLRAFTARVSHLPSRFREVQIQLIEHTKNEGKGTSVREGISRSTGTLVLIQDADLEYDPKDWPRVLDPILQNKADAVIGSRFLGSERRVLFFWHAILNHALTLLLNGLCNSLYTDIESCTKAMRGDLARSLHLISPRFGIEPEL